MISDHLVRFGQALKPALASVSDALTSRAIAMDLPLAGQDTHTRLRALGGGVRRFTAAAEDIPRLILSDKYCSDVQIANVVKPIRSAVLELAALFDIAAKVAIMPHSKRSDDTLQRITRDTLVSMAHWLADIVKMTARPEEILARGRTGSDGLISIELSMSLPTPDTLSELETWLPAHLAYRADYVHAALALLPIRMSESSFHTSIAAVSEPKAASPLCVLGGGLLIGLLLGDWGDSGD